jgi:hypothetical protein
MKFRPSNRVLNFMLGKAVNNIFRTKVSVTCISGLLGIVIVLGGLPMKPANAQQNQSEPPANRPKTPPVSRPQFLTINEDGHNPKAVIQDPNLFDAGKLYNRAVNYYYKRRGSRQAAIQDAQNAANLFRRGGDMLHRQKALELVSLL